MMPDLEIDDIKTQQAGVTILSTMLFPTDEKKRANALSKPIDELATILADEAKRRGGIVGEMLITMIQLHDMNPRLAKFKIAHWMVSGMTRYEFGPPGLEVDISRKHGIVPKDLKHVRASWHRLHSVAHFWGALMLSIRYPDLRCDLRNPEMRLAFVIHSEALAQRGEGIQLLTRPRPRALCSAATRWRIPQPRPLKFAAKPFNRFELGLLNRYSEMRH